MSRKRQLGLTTVEFALVGLVLMIMIFGVFEVGRAYYTAAMLDEITRRGARLAAVCPVNDPAIAQLAILNASGDSGTSQFVANLQPAHVVVDYLDENHAVVADPASTAGFLQIRFVRTRIEDFTYQVTLPVIAGLSTFDMPPFTYVLPRESLGVPREGAITAC
jgi:Flp pilus assembly protein TadG